MVVIEVLEYLADDGRAPFDQWLRSLDPQARGRVRVRVNRLRLGNFGDCRALGEGVSELRLAFGPGYRVYFAREGKTRAILLCGGDKSTQGKDIKRAKRYWHDHRGGQ